MARLTEEETTIINIMIPPTMEAMLQYNERVIIFLVVGISPALAATCPYITYYQT